LWAFDTVSARADIFDENNAGLAACSLVNSQAARFLHSWPGERPPWQKNLLIDLNARGLDSGGKITMQEQIEIGYHAYASDGGEEFGAVRQVSPQLVIYVENAGDFVVPLDAVEAVHSQKVILDCAKLGSELRRAIGHAHDSEEPGL
jgi:hypothetical protein